MGFHSNTLYCYNFPLYLMQVKHIFSNKLYFSLEYDKKKTLKKETLKIENN